MIGKHFCYHSEKVLKVAKLKIINKLKLCSVWERRDSNTRESINANIPQTFDMFTLIDSQIINKIKSEASSRFNLRKHLCTVI